VISRFANECCGHDIYMKCSMNFSNKIKSDTFDKTGMPVYRRT